MPTRQRGVRRWLDAIVLSFQTMRARRANAQCRPCWPGSSLPCGSATAVAGERWGGPGDARRKGIAVDLDAIAGLLVLPLGRGPASSLCSATVLQREALVWSRLATHGI